MSDRYYMYLYSVNIDYKIIASVFNDYPGQHELGSKRWSNTFNFALFRINHRPIRLLSTALKLIQIKWTNFPPSMAVV